MADDTSDIVERLRAAVRNERLGFVPMSADDITNAADEIERLRKALEPFAEFASASGFGMLPDDNPMTRGSRLARRQVTAGDFRRAKDALNGK